MSDPHTAFYNRILLMIVSAFKKPIRYQFITVVLFSEHGTTSSSSNNVTNLFAINEHVQRDRSHIITCVSLGEGVWKISVFF